MGSWTRRVDGNLEPIMSWDPPASDMLLINFFWRMEEWILRQMQLQKHEHKLQSSLQWLLWSMCQWCPIDVDEKNDDDESQFEKFHLIPMKSFLFFNFRY